MKKWLCLVLCGVLLAGLAACSENDVPTSSASITTVSGNEAAISSSTTISTTTTVSLSKTISKESAETGKTSATSSRPISTRSSKTTTPSTTVTTKPAATSPTAKPNPLSDFKYGVDKTKGIAVISQYIGQAKDVVIPGEIDGCPVTEIFPLTFFGTNIQSVTVPDSVEIIRDQAFQNCQQLKTIHFGNGLKEIGYRAFFKCTALEKVILPKAVEKIGTEAFVECTSIKEIFVPKTVTQWGTSCFFANHSLSSLTFEEGLKEIGGFATFQAALALESVTIPASVTKINDTAFSACQSLKTVYFKGNAPTSLGSYVFGPPNKAITLYHPATAAGWEESTLGVDYTVATTP